MSNVKVWALSLLAGVGAWLFANIWINYLFPFIVELFESIVFAWVVSLAIGIAAFLYVLNGYYGFYRRGED